MFHQNRPYTFKIIGYDRKYKKKVSTDTQTDEQTYIISRLIHSVSKCLTLTVITRMIDERHESKKNHSFVN